MGPIRRFGSALTVAAMLAGGLTAGSATLEAKGKGGGGGGDALTAYCTYLENILGYQYVSPYIYQYVLSLWWAAGCDKI